MLFLDGRKNTYIDALRTAEGKIRQGGIVLTSDIDKFKKETDSFVKYVTESDNFDVIKLSVCDGLIFAPKKTHRDIGC